MYTIHVFFEVSISPLIYALFPTTKTEAVDKRFSFILDSLREGLYPKDMTMDL